MHNLPKNKAVTVIGLIAVVTGTWTLIGWFFNFPGFTTLFPQYNAMKFNTAACFILLGGALLKTQFETRRFNQLFFPVLTSLAAAFAALSLSQDIFHFNAGIDQLFVSDKNAVAVKYPYPGRMAANVSLCFMLFGLGLTGFSAKDRIINVLSQYLLHLVTAISGVAIMGYLYGLSLFYKLSFVGSMAIPTACLLFLMSIIATLLHPSLGITQLFTGRLVGNKMARRLFILLVLMVLVFGSLRVQSERFGLMSTETGVSLLAVCFLFVSLILIWYTANWLNKIDSDRYEAEEEIKVINEELEERVQERTADLLELLEKFREGESKFRAAFEHSAIGMALVSFEGKWLKVNRRLCELLGYSEEELLTKTFMDITYPDDLTMSVGTAERASAGRRDSYRIEKRYLCKDGSVIWASVNISTVRDEQNMPVYMVNQIEDITERKKTDARFRTIVESGFAGIKLNDAEGNIIYRSASMQAINGWTDEEMDRKYFKLAHPDDVEKIKEVHREVLENPNKSINITYRILHKNGDYIWIESLLCNKLADPELGAIITVTRDVTDRKKMEASLLDAELRFRTMAEKSMVGVYISQKERFIYVNPRFAQIFGYEQHELENTAGSAIDLIIADEDKEIVYNNVHARYRGEIENAHYEIRGKRKDGTLNYVEFFGNRVILGGEPAIIGTMLDITERKQAEELIVREKTLSETIINSLPEVFYLRDSKGAFLRWNRNFEKVTGYSPEEIRTLDSREQLAAEDREMVKAAVEKMLKDGSATVEARVVTKAGAKIPFLITISAILYEGQPCVLGIAVDISARKKAEEELRSSEHKYKLLFESNPLPMWMIAKDDMSVIAVNDAASRLYGYAKDELLSMKATSFRHPDDMDAQMDHWQKDASVINDDRVIRHLKKDGNTMFVQIIAHDIVFEGRLVRLAFTNDITEKIRAEETLKKSEANLKTIMDTTDTAYALLDKELNVMTYNQMAEKFVNNQFHQSPPEAGRLTDYFPKERFMEFVNYAGEVLKGRSISYEISYPQPGGTVCWYYVRLFPITNDKKDILGLMLALSDITERKNAEDSLKAAYKLVQDHIDSIKEMAWKQSHLIRSPVANLKGLVSMLEMDHSNPKIQQFIKTELERLDTIIIEMAEDASTHD